MRSTNDAVVNGKGTIAVGTAAAAGAAITLQFDRSVAPPKSSGMSHVTVMTSLPGVDVAATERGGPGGDGIIEGVGVGDALQGSERHTSNMKSRAKSKGKGESKGKQRASVATSSFKASLYKWSRTYDIDLEIEILRNRHGPYTDGVINARAEVNHCCTYLADDDDVVLSLADSDEGTALTDGDEDGEAAAVMVLDGDDDSESEGEAVIDGDDDIDGAAVTDGGDDTESAVVFDGDDDSEGAAVGDTLR
jgi:hypothetical protein